MTMPFRDKTTKVTVTATPAVRAVFLRLVEEERTTQSMLIEKLILAYAETKNKQ